MPYYAYAVILISLILLLFFSIFCERRVRVLDEGVKNAMISVFAHIQKRYDALYEFVNMPQIDFEKDMIELSEKIKKNKRLVNENMPISEIAEHDMFMNRLFGFVQSKMKGNVCIKNDARFLAVMGTVLTFEKAFDISRLLYNDAVTRYNRKISGFPTSVVACIFGYKKKEYLVDIPEKLD